MGHMIASCAPVDAIPHRKGREMSSPHDTGDVVSWAPEYDQAAPTPTEVTDPSDPSYVESAADAVEAPDQTVGGDHK
jgi:hypothetical protein